MAMSYAELWERIAVGRRLFYGSRREVIRNNLGNIKNTLISFQDHDLPGMLDVLDEQNDLVTTSLFLNATSLPHNHLARTPAGISLILDQYPPAKALATSVHPMSTQPATEPILQLPAELQFEILRQLDLESLRHYAATCKAAWTMVTTLPRLQTIVTQERRLWSSIWRQELARNVTYQQLIDVYARDRCKLCGNFGEYVFLLEIIRCCGHCFATEHIRLQFVSVRFTAKLLAFTATEVLKGVPKMTCLPRAGATHRHQLLSLEHVRRFGYSRRPTTKGLALLEELFDHDNLHVASLNGSGVAPGPLSQEAQDLRDRIGHGFMTGTAQRTLVPINFTTLRGPIGGGQNQPLKLYRCTGCWLDQYLKASQNDMDGAQSLLLGVWRPGLQWSAPCRLYPEADFRRHLSACPLAGRVWQTLIHFEMSRRGMYFV